MTDTIKPPWAISLWANSDSIFAELPAINGHQAHTIRLSNDTMSLRKLLILAKSRNAKSTIGMKGDPTQFQIDKPSYDESMVRRPKPKPTFSLEQRAGARDILRKLGLI